MTTYTGGQTVGAGFYWDQGKLGAEVMPAGGGTLPGDGIVRYTRVPWPVLLVVAPVMGGAFAMFLPFLGLAMLAKHLFALVTGRRESRHSAVRI